MKMQSLMRSALALSCALAVRTAAASDATIWTVGEPDGRPAGFALAPDGFRDFLARDFGYEDKFYLVGHSGPATDFPYVLPVRPTRGAGPGPRRDGAPMKSISSLASTDSPKATACWRSIWPTTPSASLRW